MIGWDGTGQALRRGGESESKGKRHGRDQDRTEQNRTRHNKSERKRNISMSILLFHCEEWIVVRENGQKEGRKDGRMD